MELETAASIFHQLDLAVNHSFILIHAGPIEGTLWPISPLHLPPLKNWPEYSGIINHQISRECCWHNNSLHWRYGKEPLVGGGLDVD